MDDMITCIYQMNNLSCQINDRFRFESGNHLQLGVEEQLHNQWSFDEANQTLRIKFLKDRFDIYKVLDFGISDEVTIFLVEFDKEAESSYVAVTNHRRISE